MYTQTINALLHQFHELKYASYINNSQGGIKIFHYAVLYYQKKC